MKKFVALLLALTMVFALCACSNNDTGNDTSSDKVTLNVVAAQYGDQTAEWWKTFESDFEAANENIDLVVDVVSWNDISTTVRTRISNNEAPDILNIDVFADYQAEGLLLPAKDYVSEETYAKLYPSFLEQSEVDGTVWAIPDLASARALYYNKDILEAAGVEVPTTWDELTAACEKLKAYDSSIYPWGIDMTTDEGQAAFAYYTLNNGGGFVDDNGDWALDSAANVEAVNYAVGLVKSGYTNTDPATETRYTLQDLFCAGSLAMMIAPNQLSGLAEKAGINYGIASIPSNTGESVSLGVMDRFMCFDNGYTDEELAAITTFFDFFYDDDRYSAWVDMEDFLPATSTGGEVLAAADPNMANWIDIVGSSYFYPTAKAEWADVKQGVIEAEQRVLLGEDAQTVLTELQTEITGS